MRTGVEMLSEARKRELRSRYEEWGPEQVRAELVRAGRDVYTEVEVSRFAAEWLEQRAQRARRRRETLARVLMIAAVFEVTLVLAI